MAFDESVGSRCDDRARGNYRRQEMNRIILALLLSCALPAWGACNSSGGSAPTCSQTDVAACISGANAGSTITVPSGSCTWSSGISVDKGLSIVAAGSGCPTACDSATAITCTTGHCVSYTPATSRAADNLLMRISGFTFNMNGQSNNAFFLCYPNKSGSCGSGDNSADTHLQTKVRVDHNKFTNILENGGTGQHYIWYSGYRGVVDHNYFDWALYPVRTPTSYLYIGGGSCYPVGTRNCGGRAEWANFEGIVFGQADNNIWFEDNIFNLREATGVIATDCQEGQRYAFRYNTFNLSNDAAPLFDGHGDNIPSIQWSCMGYVLYGNLIVGGANKFSDQRGGRNFIFYNQLPSGAMSITLRNEADYSAGDQDTYVGPGTRYSMDVNGSYYWMNRHGVSGTIENVGVQGAAGTSPVENTGFWNYNASFNGTAGMGCGTLASRPSTCTTGVGYWATTQSCASLSGLVGQGHASDISGTLYRCVASAWDGGVALWTYPHPLIGGGSAPSAPTGFHIVSED